MTKVLPATTPDANHPLHRIASAGEREALVCLLSANRDSILTVWKRELGLFVDGSGAGDKDDLGVFTFGACIHLLCAGEFPDEEGILQRLRVSDEPPGRTAARLQHALSAMCLAITPVISKAFVDQPLKHHHAMALLLAVLDLGMSVVCSSLGQEIGDRARELEEQHTRFLEEVARLVTRDRLRLVPTCDVPMPQGEALSIREPLDCKRLRNAAAAAANEIEMPASRAEDLGLAVGEAVSNVLKHASEGIGHVWREDQTIFVRITDMGSGITTMNIPKALSLGWSSGRSLGMGFTLMLEMADALWLATGEQGTTVCIEKSTHTLHQPQSILDSCRSR